MKAIAPGGSGSVPAGYRSRQLRAGSSRRLSGRVPASSPSARPFKTQQTMTKGSSRRNLAGHAWRPVIPVMKPITSPWHQASDRPRRPTADASDDHPLEPAVLISICRSCGSTMALFYLVSQRGSSRTGIKAFLYLPFLMALGQSYDAIQSKIIRKLVGPKSPSTHNAASRRAKKSCKPRSIASVSASSRGQ